MSYQAQICHIEQNADGEWVNVTDEVIVLSDIEELAKLCREFSDNRNVGQSLRITTVEF